MMLEKEIHPMKLVFSIKIAGVILHMTHVLEIPMRDLRCVASLFPEQVTKMRALCISDDRDRK